MKTRRHFRPVALALPAPSSPWLRSPRPRRAQEAPPTDAADGFRNTQGGRDADGDPGDLATPPTSFTYAWQRCNDTGTACANIARRDRPHLRADSADVGNTNRIVVTPPTPSARRTRPRRPQP